MSKFVSCCYCEYATDYIQLGQGDDESLMGTCLCKKFTKRVNVIMGEEVGCANGKTRNKKKGGEA